jgi:hypothetical protein
MHASTVYDMQRYMGLMNTCLQSRHLRCCTVLHLLHLLHHLQCLYTVTVWHGVAPQTLPKGFGRPVCYRQHVRDSHPSICAATAYIPCKLSLIKRASLLCIT